MNKETIYHLNELGQAIVFAIQNHENRIQNIEEKMNKRDKDIDLLFKEIDRLKKENEELRGMSHPREFSF